MSDIPNPNTSWTPTRAVKNGIIEDFEKLLETTAFSDFKIIVRHAADEAKVLHVHKSILWARSSFFNSLLSNDKCSEFLNSELKIDMFPFEIMADIVSFMYCGKVTNITKNQAASSTTLAGELLIAADYFGIPTLVENCQVFLTSTLKPTNAIEILKIAWDHPHFTLLRRKAVLYISKLYKEFGSQGIAGYTEFMKANPNFEILELVCQENSIVQEAAKRQRYQMSRI